MFVCAAALSLPADLRPSRSRASAFSSTSALDTVSETQVESAPITPPSEPSSSLSPSLSNSPTASVAKAVIDDQSFIVQYSRVLSALPVALPEGHVPQLVQEMVQRIWDSYLETQAQHQAVKRRIRAVTRRVDPEDGRGSSDDEMGGNDDDDDDDDDALFGLFADSVSAHDHTLKTHTTLTDSQREGHIAVFLESFLKHARATKSVSAAPSPVASDSTGAAATFSLSASVTHHFPATAPSVSPTTPRSPMLPGAHIATAASAVPAFLLTPVTLSNSGALSARRASAASANLAVLPVPFSHSSALVTLPPSDSSSVTTSTTVTSPPQLLATTPPRAQYAVTVPSVSTPHARMSTPRSSTPPPQQLSSPPQPVAMAASSTPRTTRNSSSTPRSSEYALSDSMSTPDLHRVVVPPSNAVTASPRLLGTCRVSVNGCVNARCMPKLW